MVIYCGLDVHKTVVEACLIDEQGHILGRERFELTRALLENFARRRLGPQAKVALEATTNTWAVVEVLRPLCGQVVVGNPLATKAIAQAKVKTDKVDALVLAQLLRCDFLPTVWQPDLKTQRLRRLLSRRGALVGQQTAIKNRLHAVLAMRLLTPPGEKLFGKDGMAFLRSTDLDDEGRLLVDGDLRLLDAMAQEIAALDHVIAELGHDEPAVKLLMTMPGVGVTAASALVAALGDVSRFRDGDHAAAYLGLVPSTKQSAQRSVHGPITKRGNSQARWLLVQAAQHLRLHPGPLGHFFRKLKKKKGHSVAVVAAARKMAVIAWHLLTKNEPYRYAQPGPTQAKLGKLRVEATGAKRKTGPKPGKDGFAGPKLGAGTKSKTIPSLPELLASEGLPPLGKVPAGEARTVEAAGATAFAQSLDRPHVKLKKPRPRQETTPRADTPTPSNCPALHPAEATPAS